jgi:hypothetical protein
MIYFVIRKYKSNYSESYRIEKHTNNIDEANKFLSALSLLEQDDYVSFFVSSHNFQEPLVLTKEVA